MLQETIISFPGHWLKDSLDWQRSWAVTV